MTTIAEARARYIACPPPDRSGPQPYLGPYPIRTHRSLADVAHDERRG